MFEKVNIRSSLNKFINIIWVVLTCAFRTQVKNLKVELNHKLCLENIKFKFIEY